MARALVSLSSAEAWPKRRGRMILENESMLWKLSCFILDRDLSGYELGKVDVKIGTLIHKLDLKIKA